MLYILGVELVIDCVQIINLKKKIDKLEFSFFLIKLDLHGKEVYTEFLFFTNYSFFFYFPTRTYANNRTKSENWRQIIFSLKTEKKM